MEKSRYPLKDYGGSRGGVSRCFCTASSQGERNLENESHEHLQFCGISRQFDRKNRRCYLLYLPEDMKPFSRGERQGYGADRPPGNTRCRKTISRRDRRVRRGRIVGMMKSECGMMNAPYLPRTQRQEHILKQRSRRRFWKKKSHEVSSCVGCSGNGLATS